MYIGLFLLIPFLNILWNNMDGKKRKWLLLTLLLLTTLPSLFNCWNILGIKNVNTNTLFPNYWEMIYPFTYYFLGAYLSSGEMVSRLKAESIITLILMVCFGSFTFFRSYARKYEQMSYNNYQGIQVTIIAFLIFKIIIAIPTAKMPNTVKKVIARISELSLGIYLASAISDKIVYPKFQELISDMVHRVEYLPVAVICSFFIALIISWGIDMVYRGLDRVTKYIWSLHKSSV